MVFASLLFLFAFLPLALALSYVTPRRARNFTLLVLSLTFYAWGEQRWVAVMLASIALNWLGALLVERARGSRKQRWLLGTIIALDLGALAGFKYASFAVENLNVLLRSLHLGELSPVEPHLPLGISFFTFHAISYVVDVYRGQSRALKNPLDTALYIALFPQLIAGPIIRYHYIEEQLRARTWTLSGFDFGVRRFSLGLAKKVLIANVVARCADDVFRIPLDQLSFGLAWVGIMAYTLQIYFDFSGYSDMAIGLGSMFGFRFPENFDHPYSSRSVTEFWRRWHISLSAWFRDYLYIPLGGNRVSTRRTYLNLVVVFLLCGLWHGASWTFVSWGALHGALLVLERTRFGKLLEGAPSVLRHFYTLLAVCIAWVLFRAPDLASAFGYLKAMAGASQFSNSAHPVASVLSPVVAIAGCVGVVASAPLLRGMTRVQASGAFSAFPPSALRWLSFSVQILLLGLSTTQLAASTHNPFIYFRF